MISENAYSIGSTKFVSGEPLLMQPDVTYDFNSAFESGIFDIV